FLLSGILRCGECGAALFGQSAHGKSEVVRYYAHKTNLGERGYCSIKRFRADDAESAIERHLSEILTKAGYLDGIEQNLKASAQVLDMDLYRERDRVATELATIEKEIASAFKLHATMPETSSAIELVQETLANLADKKRKLLQQSEIIKNKFDRAD